MELTDFMTQGLIVHLSDTGVSDPLNIPRGWFIVEAEIPIVQDFPPFPLTPPPPYFFPTLRRGTVFVQRVLEANIVPQDFVRNGTRGTEFRFSPHPDFEASFFDAYRWQGTYPPEDALCRVTFKASFLIDKHGRPVDGDHLIGRLPSGDGVSGGDFESWFRLWTPLIG